MTPGHQQMYDNVAKVIEIGKHDTLLDIGCGSGEILKRVAGKGAKLYGADASTEILEAAVSNIEENGLSVVVRDASSMSSKDFRKEHKRRDRICLLVDDITNTNIKGKYSFVTSVLSQISATAITINRLWEASEFNSQIPQAMAALQLHVLAHEELIRVLGKIMPQAGRFLNVEYVLKDKIDLEIRDRVTIARGFKLGVDPHFFHSPEVYKDTDQVNPNGGYYSLLLRKE